MVIRTMTMVMVMTWYWCYIIIYNLLYLILFRLQVWGCECWQWLQGQKCFLVKPFDGISMSILIIGQLANIVTMTTIVKVYMKLHIRNITKDDFMEYRCVARNSLGDSDGSITLYGQLEENISNFIFCAEVSRPTPSTTTVVTTIGPETTTQRNRLGGLQ